MLVGADHVIRRRHHRGEIGNRVGRVAKRAERTNDGHVDLDEGAWGKADAGRSPPGIRLRSSAGNGIVR